VTQRQLALDHVTAHLSVAYGQAHESNSHSAIVGAVVLYHLIFLLLSCAISLIHLFSWLICVVRRVWSQVIAFSFHEHHATSLTLSAEPYNSQANIAILVGVS